MKVIIQLRNRRKLCAERERDREKDEWQFGIINEEGNEETQGLLS